LECGSPLPLFHRQDWRRESGRGLPHSKTLARQTAGAFQLIGRSIFETAPKQRPAIQKAVSIKLRPAFAGAPE